MNIQFIQRYEDWNNINNPYTLHPTPIKECEMSDFGTTNHDKEMYKTWKNFLLYCPDLQKKGQSGHSDL